MESEWVARFNPSFLWIWNLRQSALVGAQIENMFQS